jgi:hypothetical protein
MTKPRVIQPVKPKAAPKPVQAAPKVYYSYHEFTGCQYPIGTPGTKDFRFCGKSLDHRITGPSSYCPDCHPICYIRVRDRREEQPTIRIGDDGRPVRFYAEAAD